MKAIVKEIQVGGFYGAKSLEDACEKYSHMESGRPKIIFLIKCTDGELRQITIRDEDNQTVAYGDFEGLPSFLEYAKEEVGE